MLFLACCPTASSRRMTQCVSVACGILTKHPRWWPVAGMDSSNSGTEWRQFPWAEAITSLYACEPLGKMKLRTAEWKSINDKNFYPLNLHFLYNFRNNQIGIASCMVLHIASQNQDDCPLDLFEFLLARTCRTPYFQVTLAAFASYSVGFFIWISSPIFQ